jgi:signal peptidase I
MVSSRFKCFTGLLIVFGAAVAAQPYRLVVVRGASMQPALHDLQVVLMERSQRPLDQVHRGDIVVFRHGGETYIKRVHAVQGDEVDICRSANGYTGLLGECPFPREIVKRRLRNRFCAVKLYHSVVAPGTVFVVGDNRNCSEDSRQFGAVPEGRIVGRIVTGGRAAKDMRKRMASLSRFTHLWKPPSA